MITEEKAIEKLTLVLEDFQLFYNKSWIPDDDSMEATEDNVKAVLDYITNRKNEMQQDYNSRICENCKHGSYSWVAVDGRDIRESQYPPMIECNILHDKYLKYPDFGCNKFEPKEESK